VPPTVVFTANELKTYQPDLAARVEEEISEGAAASSEEGTLHCRITERRAERAHIVVQLEGQGWSVTFTVTVPLAVGEVRLETKKSLRDRGRRVANYRRSTRR
jgi:hypothetical protein